MPIRAVIRPDAQGALAHGSAVERRHLELLCVKVQGNFQLGREQGRGRRARMARAAPGEEATQSCPIMSLQWYVLSHPCIPHCGDYLEAGRVHPLWQSSKEIWKKAHRV